MLSTKMLGPSPTTKLENPNCLNHNKDLQKPALSSCLNCKVHTRINLRAAVTCQLLAETAWFTIKCQQLPLKLSKNRAAMLSTGYCCVLTIFLINRGFICTDMFPPKIIGTGVLLIHIVPFHDVKVKMWYTNNAKWITGFICKETINSNTM
jgi:xanthine/uracil permease